MKRCFEIAAIAALLGMSFAFFEIGWTLRIERPKFETTLENFNELIAETSQTAANVQAATQSWQAASNQQQKYWAGLEKKAGRDLADLDLLISHSDARINGELLPAATQTLHDTSADEGRITLALETNAAAVTRDLDSFSTAASKPLADADAQLADPHIAATLAHLDSTSASLDASAKDVAAFIHRETTPVRGAWNAIKAFLREFAGPAAQVTVAVK